jgi:hypothetical protein
MIIRINSCYLRQLTKISHNKIYYRKSIVGKFLKGRGGTGIFHNPKFAESPNAKYFEHKNNLI